MGPAAGERRLNGLHTCRGPGHRGWGFTEDEALSSLAGSALKWATEHFDAQELRLDLRRRRLLRARNYWRGGSWMLRLADGLNRASEWRSAPPCF